MFTVGCIAWLRAKVIQYASFGGFMMREDDFVFHEHGLISITAYWMPFIHIPFTHFNITVIGLAYYMILTFSL
jgi:hypothetical protein